MGANNLVGTCVIGGECDDNGGIATGSCSTVTSQAKCCVYQMACGMTTEFNNTYFHNPGFPDSYRGGSRFVHSYDRMCLWVAEMLISEMGHSV